VVMVPMPGRIARNGPGKVELSKSVEGERDLNQHLPEPAEPKPRGTKRTRNERNNAEEYSYDDSTDNQDFDSIEEPHLQDSGNTFTTTSKRHRPKRQRKRTESVQRAIEEELQREEKKKFRGKKSKSSDQDEGADEEEKLPEDGVLAIDKFHLKRYNTLTKQCEYLVQWNGYDIHRSAWIGKKDIFAADYLSDFEETWDELLKKKNQDSGNNSGSEVSIDMGDKVWVKLKGHQWWPAQVVVREKVMKGEEEKNEYTVVFYGDNTFAFVNDYTPGQFLLEKFDGNVAKFRRKANEKAVQQALAMLPDEPE